MLIKLSKGMYNPSEQIELSYDGSRAQRMAELTD